MLFKKPGGVSWLIVFLGNPGLKYEGTRHNAGFMAADAMAREKDISINRARFKALTATVDIGGESVMLMKPPMLILDEATSSIDTRTELKVQDAFNTLMQGRTSFVVAHRLPTIRHADCILVMKDGKVAEQGTHEELLAKNGFYTKLYNSQFAQ